MEKNYCLRVSSRIFQLGVQASLSSHILCLITTLGKSLTRPFPGVAIKQRVWSARLRFSRSSMQRDLSMPQCIPLKLLERGDFRFLHGWADPENLEGWDPIEAKVNCYNHIVATIKWLTCICVWACRSKQSGWLRFGLTNFHLPIVQSSSLHKGRTTPDWEKMSDNFGCS